MKLSSPTLQLTKAYTGIFFFLFCISEEKQPQCVFFSGAEKLAMATESWSVFSKSSLSRDRGLGKRATTKTPGGVPEVGLTWDSFYECRSVHSFHKITLVMG